MKERLTIEAQFCAQLTGDDPVEATSDCSHVSAARDHQKLEFEAVLKDLTDYLLSGGFRSRIVELLIKKPKLRAALWVQIYKLKPAQIDEPKESRYELSGYYGIDDLIQEIALDLIGKLLERPELAAKFNVFRKGGKNYVKAAARNCLYQMARDMSASWERGFVYFTGSIEEEVSGQEGSGAIRKDILTYKDIKSVEVKAPKRKSLMRKAQRIEVNYQSNEVYRRLKQLQKGRWRRRR